MSLINPPNLQGGFGLVINITVFCLLLSLDTNKVTLTEGQQHWRKQVVTLFGSVLNIVLAAAGVGLVGLLGVRVAESKSMIIPLVWATIQAYVPGIINSHCTS